MPTLAELQDACSRDLRDPNKRVFTDVYLTDLINSGQEEVGRIYPRELLATVAITGGTYTYTMPDAVDVFRVEVWRNGGFSSLVPPAADAESSQVGWDLWAGSLRFPKAFIDGLSASLDSLRVWGYGRYPTLVNDNDESLLDQSGEQGVRRFVRSQAFQTMHADRAQFKQWQGQANNSDVTPNMLTQMVAFYTSEWDRTRNHLRRLRRQ